jgi:hypothetical protein
MEEVIAHRRAESIARRRRQPLTLQNTNETPRWPPKQAARPCEPTTAQAVRQDKRRSNDEAKESTAQNAGADLDEARAAAARGERAVLVELADLPWLRKNKKTQRVSGSQTFLIANAKRR